MTSSIKYGNFIEAECILVTVDLYGPWGRDTVNAEHALMEAEMASALVDAMEYFMIVFVEIVLAIVAAVCCYLRIITTKCSVVFAPNWRCGTNFVVYSAPRCQSK